MQLERKGHSQASFCGYFLWSFFPFLSYCPNISPGIRERPHAFYSPGMLATVTISLPNSRRQGPSCSSWTTFVLSMGSVRSWGKQKLPRLTTISLLPIYPCAEKMGEHPVTNHTDFPLRETKTALPQQRLGWGATTQPNPMQQWQNEGNRNSLKCGLIVLLPLFHWSTISWSGLRGFYLKYQDQFFCPVTDNVLDPVS